MMKDLPDRGGPDLVAESGEFAVDAAIPPCRILGGQATDQAAESGGDGGSTGSCRLGGPAAGDQLVVPAQDGGGRDEQPEASADWEQSGEGGDQGAIGPADPRARRTSLEHGELMTQDQDLDLLGGVGTGAQGHPAQQLGEDPIDQHQRHRLIMLGCERRRTGRSTGVRGVWGTHRPIGGAEPGFRRSAGRRSSLRSIFRQSTTSAAPVRQARCA
jgi:hypothetical protein